MVDPPLAHWSSESEQLTFALLLRKQLTSLLTPSLGGKKKAGKSVNSLDPRLLQSGATLTSTGYVIYEGATEYDSGSFSLPQYSTVFQAELIASFVPSLVYFII